MLTHELWASAKAHFDKGEYSKAESDVEMVLNANPEDAKAWHLRGISNAQLGQLEEAAAYFENAVRLEPTNANFHYNLGLAYKKLQQTERAVEAYRKALVQREDFLEARNNLGNSLIEIGHTGEAIRCFRELVARCPESSDAHYNLANLLIDTGNDDESVEHYRLALKLNPESAEVRENLGRALAEVGRTEESELVWRAWLERDPDNAIARHMLASMSGEDVPSRCDNQYIRDTFDELFAQSIDDQMARLKYRGPELIAKAICDLPEELAGIDVLDAGCGTGLCGAIVEGIAKRLVGVDLSEDMLAEARKRQIYGETIVSEITEFMRHASGNFDLVISADTLCYFGELDEALSAAFNCLKAGGVMIFTVERDGGDSDGKGYQLQQNGRYRHARQYVEDALHGAGFTACVLTEATLRNEGGVAVAGLVVRAIRPGSISS